MRGVQVAVPLHAPRRRIALLKSGRDGYPALPPGWSQRMRSRAPGRERRESPAVSHVRRRRGGRATRAPSAPSRLAPQLAVLAGMAVVLFSIARRAARRWEFAWLRLRCGADDRPPVDDCVPQHALIAAIQIAMQRVEVECDDVTLSRGQVEDRRMADQVLLSPRLTTHDERCALVIPPFEHHATRIHRSIETGGAVRHA